ncbi:alpha/beta hydrolases superfamily protein, partial [Tanacetum coccineum]
KCFRCGNPNHLIRECPKPPKDKNQRAFVGGSWSDSGEEDDEKVKDETCLVAHASSETRWSTKPTSWLSRNMEQLSTSKLHAMGNVSSILTSQPITSNAKYALESTWRPDEWIKDSGCSKHMTGNQKLFLSYKAYNRGNVIFGS